MLKLMHALATPRDRDHNRQGEEGVGARAVGRGAKMELENGNTEPPSLGERDLFSAVRLVVSTIK